MTAGPSPSRSACPRRIAPRRDANSYDDGNITPTAAAAATLRGIAGPPRSWGRRVYDFFFFLSFPFYRAFIDKTPVCRFTRSAPPEVVPGRFLLFFFSIIQTKSRFPYFSPTIPLWIRKTAAFHGHGILIDFRLISRFPRGNRVNHVGDSVIFVPEFLEFKFKF